MKALVSLVAAPVILVVIWELGGPVGAWLNVPGLLLLRAAAALGIPEPGTEPTLRGWLWLGTALSTFFWGLVAYAASMLAGRRGRAGPEKRTNAEGGS